MEVHLCRGILRWKREDFNLTLQPSAQVTLFICDKYCPWCCFFVCFSLNFSFRHPVEANWLIGFLCSFHYPSPHFYIESIETLSFIAACVPTGENHTLSLFWWPLVPKQKGIGKPKCYCCHQNRRWEEIFKQGRWLILNYFSLYRDFL